MQGGKVKWYTDMHCFFVGRKLISMWNKRPTGLICTGAHIFLSTVLVEPCNEFIGEFFFFFDDTLKYQLKYFDGLEYYTIDLNIELLLISYSPKIRFVFTFIDRNDN